MESHYQQQCNQQQQQKQNFNSGTFISKNSNGEPRFIDNVGNKKNVEGWHFEKNDNLNVPCKFKLINNFGLILYVHDNTSNLFFGNPGQLQQCYIFYGTQSLRLKYNDNVNRDVFNNPIDRQGNILYNQDWFTGFCPSFDHSGNQITFDDSLGYIKPGNKVVFASMPSVIPCCMDNPSQNNPDNRASGDIAFVNKLLLYQQNDLGFMSLGDESNHLKMNLSEEIRDKLLASVCVYVYAKMSGEYDVDKMIKNIDQKIDELCKEYQNKNYTTDFKYSQNFTTKDWPLKQKLKFCVTQWILTKIYNANDKGKTIIYGLLYNDIEVLKFLLYVHELTKQEAWASINRTCIYDNLYHIRGATYAKISGDETRYSYVNPDRMKQFFIEMKNKRNINSNQQICESSYLNLENFVTIIDKFDLATMEDFCQNVINTIGNVFDENITEEDFISLFNTVFFLNAVGHQNLDNTFFFEDFKRKLNNISSIKKLNEFQQILQNDDKLYNDISHTDNYFKQKNPYIMKEMETIKKTIDNKINKQINTGIENLKLCIQRNDSQTFTTILDVYKNLDYTQISKIYFELSPILMDKQTSGDQNVDIFINILCKQHKLAKQQTQQQSVLQNYQKQQIPEVSELNLQNELQQPLLEFQQMVQQMQTVSVRATNSIENDVEKLKDCIQNNNVTEFATILEKYKNLDYELFQEKIVNKINLQTKGQENFVRTLDKIAIECYENQEKQFIKAQQKQQETPPQEKQQNNIEKKAANIRKKIMKEILNKIQKQIECFEPSNVYEKYQELRFQKLGNIDKPTRQDIIIAKSLTIDCEIAINQSRYQSTMKDFQTGEDMCLSENILSLQKKIKNALTQIYKQRQVFENLQLNSNNLQKTLNELQDIYNVMTCPQDFNNLKTDSIATKISNAESCIEKYRLEILKKLKELEAQLSTKENIESIEQLEIQKQEYSEKILKKMEEQLENFKELKLCQNILAQILKTKQDLFKNFIKIFSQPTFTIKDIEEAESHIAENENILNDLEKMKQENKEEMLTKAKSLLKKMEEQLENFNQLQPLNNKDECVSNFKKFLEGKKISIDDIQNAEKFITNNEIELNQLKQLKKNESMQRQQGQLVQQTQRKSQMKQQEEIQNVELQQQIQMNESMQQQHLIQQEKIPQQSIDLINSLLKRLENFNDIPSLYTLQLNAMKKKQNENLGMFKSREQQIKKIQQILQEKESKNNKLQQNTQQQQSQLAQQMQQNDDSIGNDIDDLLKQEYNKFKQNDNNTEKLQINHEFNQNSMQQNGNNTEKQLHSSINSQEDKQQWQQSSKPKLTKEEEEKRINNAYNKLCNKTILSKAVNLAGNFFSSNIKTENQAIADISDLSIEAAQELIDRLIKNINDKKNNSFVERIAVEQLINLLTQLNNKSPNNFNKLLLNILHHSKNPEVRANIYEIGLVTFEEGVQQLQQDLKSIDKVNNSQQNLESIDKANNLQQQPKKSKWSLSRFSGIFKKNPNKEKEQQQQQQQQQQQENGLEDEKYNSSDEENN